MSDQPIPRIRTGGNPFAAQWTQPGAIDFLFSPETDATDLIEALRNSNWHGQIIGPHGSGKSTLLETLIPLLEKAGRIIRRSTQHDGQSSPDWQALDLSSWTASTLILIDGWEQLSRWSRFCLRRLTRRHNCGLIITSHQNAGLPELFQTKPSLEVVRQLVAHLTTDEPEDRKIADAVIVKTFHNHNGNIRDTLFALYDVVARQ